MASFMVDLWSSIFTPGATPTLLIATNTTFAALQLVLFALLFATYSIHFLILSIISAALWWSINWFAAELQQIKAKDGSSNPETNVQTNKNDQSVRPPGNLDPSESETETESLAGGDAKVSTINTPGMASATTARRPPQAILRRETTPAASTKQPPQTANSGQAKQPGDSSGYVSTDSEWEKVDEDRQ